MATSVTPNTNPFAGGSFTPGIVPNLNGAIQPAASGGSLIGGVQGSAPMIARNNRGSNITVPYARVVMHAPQETALAPVGSTDKPSRTGFNPAGRFGAQFYVETENLYSGRVAFVLGRRGKGYEQPGISAMDSTERDGNATVQRVPFRAASAVAKFAVGGADVNTLQRMCSFDYLERYFHHVLRKKIIEVGADNQLADVNMPVIPSSLRKFRGQVRTQKLTKFDADALLTAIATSTKSAGYDDLKKVKQIDAPLRNSGIFLKDVGPFLRGKTLEKSIARIGANKMPLPLDIGDRISFQRLEQLIAETGALDWQPDGIVHSKLSQGDTMLDDELDSRDGMLFNITVQGPSITTSWANDYKMAVMPLDKVFLVIVADVWYGVAEKDAQDAWGTGYAAARGAEINPSAEQLATEANAAFAGDEKAAITNMKVRLMTSSEMISFSSVNDGRLGLKRYDGNPAPALNKSPSTPAANATPPPLQPRGSSAEAVQATPPAPAPTPAPAAAPAAAPAPVKVAEYIIGGWCIGTVLDNAAARSSREGVALMGAVKKQRISHGINVAVKVEWWSADRMYRSFMNVNGQIRTRYTGAKPNNFRGNGSILASATQRSVPVATPVT
jgi:hypothetical protein